MTPYVTLEDLGYVAVVLSVTSITESFQTMGIQITVSNIFYKHNGSYKIIVRSALGMTLIWSIVYALLILLLYWIFVPEEIINRFLLIFTLVGLPSAVFGGVTTYGQLHFQLLRRPELLSAVTVPSAIIGGAALYLSSTFYELGYLAFLIAFAVSVLSKGIMLSIILLKDVGGLPIFQFRIRNWKSRIIIGLKTVPHYYSGYILNSSDKIMLSALSVSPSTLGVYEAVSRLGAIVNAISVALNKSVAPRIFGELKRKDEFGSNRLSNKMQWILMCTCILFSLSAPEVINFLFKIEGIDDYYGLCVPVVMAFSYRGAYVKFTTRLFYNEQIKKIVFITTISALINLLLNWFFIPIYGIHAAAWSTYICFMVMGYVGFFLRSNIDSTMSSEIWLIWFALSIISVATISYVIDKDFIIRIMCAVLLCTLCYITFLAGNRYHDK